MWANASAYIAILCGIALPIVSAYTSSRRLDAALRVAMLLYCCHLLLTLERGMHYDEMSIMGYLGVVITASIVCQLPLALWCASLAVARPFSKRDNTPGHLAHALSRCAERHRTMILRSLCFPLLASAILLFLRYLVEASLRDSPAYDLAIYASTLVLILPEWRRAK